MSNLLRPFTYLDSNYQVLTSYIVITDEICKKPIIYPNYMKIIEIKK